MSYSEMTETLLHVSSITSVVCFFYRGDFQSLRCYLKVTQYAWRKHKASFMFSYLQRPSSASRQVARMLGPDGVGSNMFKSSLHRTLAVLQVRCLWRSLFECPPHEAWRLILSSPPSSSSSSSSSSSAASSSSLLSAFIVCSGTILPKWRPVQGLTVHETWQLRNAAGAAGDAVAALPKGRTFIKAYLGSCKFSAQDFCKHRARVRRTES